MFHLRLKKKRNVIMNDSFFSHGNVYSGKFFSEYIKTQMDATINIMKYCTGNYRLHELSIANIMNIR